MYSPSLHWDPVEALNARAQTEGWTFACDRLLKFEAPELRAMTDLWQSHVSPDKLPARADFSARALKDVLRDMMIFDVVPAEERNRFRCRYIGSHVVSYLGEMTGAFLDEWLPPLTNERTAACYDTIIEARCPLRFVTRFSLDKINYLSAEFVVVPLASDGVKLDKIMSVTHFRTNSAGQPLEPRRCGAVQDLHKGC